MTGTPIGTSNRQSPPRSGGTLRVGSGAAARDIAYLEQDGGDPLIVWLGGLRSDMRGAKADRIAAFAERQGFGFRRFDYSGHGASGGDFIDGTISCWTEEAAAILAMPAPRRVILAGSSMGAWIALRLAARLRERRDGPRLQGLLLLAPAPDFTRRLVEPNLTTDQREALATTGHLSVPSAYSPEPTIYTKALLDDGALNLVMEVPIETGCPIHIIHGTADPDVPYAHALDLVACLPADAVTLTLVPGGDHRLSREEDLVLIEAALARLGSEID